MLQSDPIIRRGNIMIIKKIIRWAGIITTLLLMSACIPEGVRLPQSPMLQMFERKSGLIAYIGLDGNIYTINQSGGNLTAITEDATPIEEDGSNWRQYGLPTWAREGGQLAFTEINRISAGRTSGAIHISDPDGNKHVVAFDSNDHFPFYLYWTPDGEQVSFLASSSGSSTLALRVVPADGKGDALVIDTGQPYYWAWAPNSQYLLAHVGNALSTSPSEDRLAFLTAKNPVTQSTLNYVPSRFQAPDFSPDGESILLASVPGTQQQSGQLVLATNDGAKQSVLASFEGPIAFSWAPAGDYVAYIEGFNTSGVTRGDLTFVNVKNSRNPIKIETEAENVIAFFWSPDGEEVVYFVPHTSSSGEEEGEESDSDLPAQFFLSLHVAEAKNGNTRDLGSFIPSTEFLNIIPYFNQYQRSATIWSPDGENIVISGLGGNEGVPIILLVPSSGNLEPRFLVEGTSAYWSWK